MELTIDVPRLDTTHLVSSVTVPATDFMTLIYDGKQV
jgi:hypothetical protein